MFSGGKKKDALGINGLITFTKSSILDLLQGSAYPSDIRTTPY